VGTARFIFGLVAAPIVTPLLAVAYFTPAYVPSDYLVEAAAMSPAPQIDMADGLRAFCPSEWDVEAADFERPMRLYSWENDEGLFAVTEIACVPGQVCRARARALLSTRGGMKMWGSCGQTGVGLVW
jgi:hypothetical protein